RLRLLDLSDRHRIVAAHDHLRAQLTQVLHEVVRERIVVVYDEKHEQFSVFNFRFSVLGISLKTENRKLKTVYRFSACCNSAAISVKWPASAHWRAVLPETSLSFGFAPCSRSVSTIS